MAHLNLALLGSFQLTLEEPITVRIESDKVRGLLAFLAVEPDRPHPRAALAELLWPELPEHAAAANFRRALANLGAVIGDRRAHTPHLHITRATVHFNNVSDAVVDIARFHCLLQTPETDAAWANNLEQAFTLYRGPFLEGFHLDGCPEFEEWMGGVRSELEQLAAHALQQLAHHYQGQGNMERALALYRRCLTLAPYNEAVQRGVLLALAASGQRADALTHYAAYHRQLQDEVGVEPEVQTVELAAALEAGLLDVVEASRSLGLTQSTTTRLARQEQSALHPFVGRQAELASLHVCVRQAAQSQGSVVFVLGEAGSGKTALLYELAHQLGRTSQAWMVACGDCTALLGIGDPYQPFVDALRNLIGGEASASAGGLASFNQSARPLIHGTEVVHLLQKEAPDWVPLVLAGAEARATAATADQRATSSAQTPPGMARSGPGGQSTAVPQAALFDQLTRLLIRLALHQPLLLALDNLHWATAATVALLYHLAQHVQQSRILLVGAYRPGALALEEAAHRQSLGIVVHELQWAVGAALIDLDQADGRRFIDALLDQETNHLDEPFRAALYGHSEGHALFTVELLHTLRENGSLSQGSDGHWVTNGGIDWGALPPRIEALIGERIERLLASDRDLLNAACVQGDEFSVDVVATVCEIQERVAIERLSGELATAHRLVLPFATRAASGLAAHYRFRHHLFQRYLYGALDEAQRVYLHGAVGLALEQLYAAQGRASGVTLQALAWHFIRAGEQAKAIDYLAAASEQAMVWHAYGEAIDALSNALALASAEDHSLRFDLLAAREQAHALLRDQPARVQEVGELERLAALSQQPRQQVVAALRQATLMEETAHYLEAVTTANAALALATANQDRPAVVQARLVAGRAHWWRGEIEMAHRHYAYALRQARSLQSAQVESMCLVHLGIADWSLGDLGDAEAAFCAALEYATAPEQLLLRCGALMGLGMVACTRSEYAQAEGMLGDALALARQLHHPWIEGQVLLNQVALHRLWASYTVCLVLYPQLLQHCQTIDDRWTTTAAQMEAVTLFVQLGAWEKAQTIIGQATVTASVLGASLLKLRLLLLQLRLALATREEIVGHNGAIADWNDQALALAHKLGVASLLAEAWLLSGLVQQRLGQVSDADSSLTQAREAGSGEASRRLLPEIVGAQVQLAMAQGDRKRALAYVAELIGDNSHPLIEQAMDPSSIYMICYTVLDAIGEPWAGQMLVRGRRLLAEQASLIPDEELRHAYCEDIALHRQLLAEEQFQSA